MHYKKTIAALAIMLAAGTAQAVEMDYTYGGAPVAIPDNDANGVTTTISIADSGTITDLDVGLFIEHTWQGDLIVSLEHNGTSVTLLHRAGDGSGGGFGFSADDFGTAGIDWFILDDEATNFYDSAAGFGTVPDPGIPAVTGSWLPFDALGLTSLSVFDGMDINGDWNLTISDNAGGDTGSLLDFALFFDVDAGPVGAPEPGILALFGLALFSMVVVRRSRK